MPLLTIKNLHTHFASHKAVDGLDLDINEGETVALVGESGSGKTMTALSIMQLVPPPGKICAGNILFQNNNLLERSEKEMQQVRGRHIGLVMQDPLAALNPVIRIGEQISEVLRHHFRHSRKKAHAEALDMLRTVQLEDIENTYNKYPHQLSGGERQRALIAIALACRPKLLIADEPTTALDVTIQSQVLNLLASLKKQFNLSLLLITHDLAIVSEVADRVAVMYAGKIVELASVRDLFQNPRHPYTQLLLQSMPKVHFEATEKIHKFEIHQTKTGLYTDTGCAFAPRCPLVREQCRATVPLQALGGGRLLRCIH
jgi:oligopeptide/dipeptide ABC transporter ATP-binding protein